MLSFPNCKINIGLYVTQKRPDGYHNLETLFYPLPLTDVLEFVPAPESKMHLSGLSVAGNTDNNLVWKAYMLLQQYYPEQIPQLDIYLHKNIPMGAGIGGGSADGAFMLSMLNQAYELGLSQLQLAQYALQLGSDCPFFIYNTPMFASGRGEALESLSLDLSAYSIQLICPEVHVSTKEAFSTLSPSPAPFNLKDINALPITEWKNRISNDFEKTVFAIHPALAAIKENLYQQGAIYASMSGSGSSIYGIFPKGAKAHINSTVAFKDVYVEHLKSYTQD